MMMEPDRVRGFLEVLKEVTVMHALSQRDLGVDVIHIYDHATGDLIRAETYRDFLLPVTRDRAVDRGPITCTAAA